MSGKQSSQPLKLGALSVNSEHSPKLGALLHRFGPLLWLKSAPTFEKCSELKDDARQWERSVNRPSKIRTARVLKYTRASRENRTAAQWVVMATESLMHVLAALVSKARERAARSEPRLRRHSTRHREASKYKKDASLPKRPLTRQKLSAEWTRATFTEPTRGQWGRRASYGRVLRQ